MSLFRYSDYSKKKETIHRTKIPTKSKTISHKCSQCTRTDARKYPISEKESRWLCPVHVNQHNQRDIKERPHYVKASQL